MTKRENEPKLSSCFLCIDYSNMPISCESQSADGVYVARSPVCLIKRSSQSQHREDRPPLSTNLGDFFTFYEEKYGFKPRLDQNNRVRQSQMSRLLNMNSSLVSQYVSESLIIAWDKFAKTVSSFV